MTENLTPEEMIRANAELVLAFARENGGPDVGFDKRGVQWLDTYIHALLAQGDVEASEQLCDNLGSVLGTSIIETFGGTWQDTEHGWAVVLEDDLAVFPFNKVYKHLTGGAGDSVLSFFDTIPALPQLTEPNAKAPAPASADEPAAAKSSSVISKLGRLFRRR